MELPELEAFVARFKELRAKFGLTQDDVGLALGRRHGTEVSQTTISRFEALQLSFTNMCKLYPMMKSWIDNAEKVYVDGLHALQLIQKVEQASGKSDEDSSQGSGPIRRRRKRTSLDENQKNCLERSYSLNKKASKQELTRLSKALNLDYAVIRCWFSNRRQKDRSLQKQEDEDDVSFDQLSESQEKAEDGNEDERLSEEPDAVHAIHLILPKTETS